MGQGSLDAVLSVLVASVRSSMLDAVLAVGEVLFEHVYGGDEAQVRSKGRKKISLEDIASQPGSGVSASWLCRAVNIFLQVRGMPEELAEQLSVSHHRQLLRLKGDLERKVELAQLAVEGSWSVQRLEAKVTTALGERDNGRGTTGKTDGRPRINPLEHARRGLELAEERLSLDGSELGSMNPADVLGLVADLKRAAQRLLARLEAIEGGLSAEESCRVATLVGPTRVRVRDRSSSPRSGIPMLLAPADPLLRAPPPPDPRAP